MNKMNENKEIRVLYMEDDPGLAKLFKKKLEGQGYRVDIAENGKIGLEMYESGLYDIIAVDQIMPELEGIDVIKIISSRDDPPPVIMITGAGNEMVAVQAMKFGATDYIIKDTGGNYLELLPALIEKIMVNHRIKIEKIEAQKDLRESEEKYRNLVEMAADGILIISDDVVGYTNERLAEISGYSVNEILSRPFTDFFQAEEVPNLLKHFKDFTSGEKPNTVFESVMQNKDGTKIFTEINIGKLCYNGQDSIMALVRDITMRKKMEEEIIKSQKLESIGMLAGGIAHDFNNILTGILGNISLAMMDCDPDDEIYKTLGEAEKASLRAKDLVNQFIIFSNGGAPIKKIISIGYLIEDTAAFSLSGTGIQSEINIEKDLWQADVDEQQVRQLINNLLINAKEEMNNRGSISLRAENQYVSAGSGLPVNSGKYIRIVFTDKGTGIPPEIMSKIYDPFFTTKPKNKGLGLTAAFLIIKRHNGHITVDSTPGEGTTVTVYFPAVDNKGGVSEKS